MNNYNYRRRAIMTQEDLMNYAPSIYTEDHQASDKYSQISTAGVIEILGNCGWQPILANQQSVRNMSRNGYQKHLVKFKNVEQDLRIGDQEIELVLVNSHDGKCSYQIMTGLFRFVCSNGIINGDVSSSYQLRHVGITAQDVIDVSYSVVENAPQLKDGIQLLQGVTLNPQEKEIFANAAITLKYPEEKPIEPVRLLSKRRYADDGEDLWTTFNVVQENLVKGGQSYYTDTGRRTTRAVKGIDSNVRLNKALWTLATEMAKLKG